VYHNVMYVRLRSNGIRTPNEAALVNPSHSWI
jgi:hypothetical protein